MAIVSTAAPALHVRRRRLGSVATLAALALTLVTPGLVLAWDANSFSSSDEALLVQLTNQARASAGLPALTVDPALTSIARWRSKDMIDRNYFCHSIPPTGATIPASCVDFPASWPKVFAVMQSDGYCFTLAGENIGTNNFPDDIATATIQQGFMDSPGHRANILGPAWNRIGVGAYKGANGQHMWTVLFAAKCGAGPAATPKPTPRPTPRPTTRATAAPRATARPTARPTVPPTVAATSAATADSTPTPSDGPTDAPPATPGSTIGATPGTGPSPGSIETAGPGAGGFGGPGNGLQVIDQPSANDFVDTIVGTVAGAYFGG